jgi:hypothetical protein
MADHDINLSDSITITESASVNRFQFETPSLANDKYRATLRSTWIASPPDSSILVDAIPANLPTLITLGWDTQYETVFRVEATSGDNSSNYALTGVTRVKGANTNIPEGTSANCLNHEEFFNQWGEQLQIAQVTVEEASDLINNLIVSSSITSSATPTPTGNGTFNRFYITALGAAAELQPPSGTLSNGNSLIIRIKDNGTARALTYDSVYRAIGMTLPTTTVISKTMYLGAIYNSADSKWDVVASQEEV